MAELPKTARARIWGAIVGELNFYRVHTLYITFTPLILSAIFYASNGQTHISYIDSLFNCVSAMTVTGLAVNDLSSLTPWQQVMLFFQMSIGGQVIISWFIILARKQAFAKEFDTTGADALRTARGRQMDTELARKPFSHRLAAIFSKNSKVEVVEQDKEFDGEKQALGGKLYTHMIRRVDDAPKLVNPSGWISETPREDQQKDVPVPSAYRAPDVQIRSHEADARRKKPPRRLSDPGMLNAKSGSVPMQRAKTVHDTDHPEPPVSKRIPMHKTVTVEFAPNYPRRRRREHSTTIRERSRSLRDDDARMPRTSTHRGVSMEPRFSINAQGPSIKDTKHTGFGGWPMPHELISAGFNKFFPTVSRKLTRTITIPATTTMTSVRGDGHPGHKYVPYISFSAVVGRNSEFHMLTSEQMEEIGGVEYRALNALLWIVGLYHVCIQLLGFLLVAPYISSGRQFSEAFVPPAQHRALAPPWFSLFQVVSAYTNTGTSLVDQSMVPFQKAYLMIFVMIILILAGNTAYPILLRFIIWSLTKMVKRDSRLNETLHFLLDHPRRCYIYLFPSHQTWFLLTVLCSLTFTDWFFFMVLDINNPGMESIGLGTRFLAGFLQGVAVRAAGFAIVPLASLAPAVKVLYVVMMYISVYPIAMSVRSTNVYEEKSLGIYSPEEDNDTESVIDVTGDRIKVWSRYLGMHARKQLSFDMWWLGLALFLVCIIERRNIEDPSTDTWFNTFIILFELVSAYGTVGLSLGLPYANYSFSGGLSKLSKLIVIFVMIRGRHRGLPVAIDRAVIFNGADLKPDPENDADVEDDPSDTVSEPDMTHIGGLEEIAEDPASRRPSHERTLNGSALSGSQTPYDRSSSLRFS
ncbi:cation transport protein-domain-containing protein [Pterulicium gracile]|uniref:Potassium transport protein n=1 Tax=Pterulicium gracile TaxID=1884261 RepID=A0A5C3QYS1_9AGAR|nr:cation transport protein-domain-containing protein [Pterula gracilis]